MSTITLRPNSIEHAFQSCNGNWEGCDWFTKFGKTELNLRAIRSSHALFMARATSGQEKTDWLAAVHWLAEIERHADEAAREAALALKQIKAGDLQEALHHAQRACDIEERYHPIPVWTTFKDAIESMQSDHQIQD
jgi:hypothetical protein